MLMRERDKIDAPEVDEIFFSKLIKSVAESMKYRVAVRLYAVGNYDLSLLNEVVGQEIYEDSISALFPEPFVPGTKSTRSAKRSEKTEVSTRAVSSSLSVSATEDPRSRSARIAANVPLECFTGCLCLIGPLGRPQAGTVANARRKLLLASRAVRWRDACQRHVSCLTREWTRGRPEVPIWNFGARGPRPTSRI